jgi:hypothetical protein
MCNEQKNTRKLYTDCIQKGMIIRGIYLLKILICDIIIFLYLRAPAWKNGLEEANGRYKAQIFRLGGI